MSMNRREFLQILAAASTAGITLNNRELLAAQGGEKLYDLPHFGNVHLLHSPIATPVAADLFS